jgi:pilus assembly protein CpaE
MSQPDASKLQGNWKALFLCPNSKIVRELTPLLSRLLGSFTPQEFNAYPNRHQLNDVLAAESPNLCVLEVSDPLERGLAVIPDITRADPKLPIVVVLSNDDPAVVLRCLRQGASDFLIQPFTSEQVEAALRKIARTHPARSKNPGKVYCVMPAKGGCGASTIAGNLAYQLKRLGDKRILLADLDPLAGTQSFLLKIKSNYSFIDVIAHAHQIDADLWKAVINPRNGVDVLLAPEILAEGMSELKDASALIEFARDIYDLAVLDAAGVYGEWNLSQAQVADEILLITTNELTSLQAVQRALTYLEANGIGRYKIRLIVNRYDRHMGLSRDVIGTALHSDIYHLIPADYEAIQKALIEGKPLAPTTNFGKGVAGLVELLAGGSELPRKSNSLAGLMSLFSRTSS